MGRPMPKPAITLMLKLALLVQMQALSNSTQLATSALTVTTTTTVTKNVAYLMTLFIGNSCYQLIKLFTLGTDKYHMRFCIFLTSFLLIVIPARPQDLNTAVTALGGCLSVLDLKIRAQMLSPDTSNNLPIIVLKNTLNIYNQIIQDTMDSNVQMQIVGSYLTIRNQFISALMLSQDQDLEELVADLNIISQQCVDKGSYQSGNIE
jgi:hypothetical protein